MSSKSRNFLHSVLRKVKRREKNASDSDHLTSKSRPATDDNQPDSPSTKADSSHTGNQVVVDSVQISLSKTAPLASPNFRPDIKAYPVSIEESEHPDTGRRLITFAFDADDLLAALLNSKHKSLPPVPGGENIEGTANITVDTSHAGLIPSDVVDVPIVLSAPASKPLEVGGTDFSQLLESEGEEGHSNKSETPCYKFLPHQADLASRAPLQIPSLDLEPVTSCSDSRAAYAKTNFDAEVDKAWRLSPLSLAEESLGAGTSEMNPLPRSEPSTVSSHKNSENSIDYGDEQLDSGSGHPSPAPPPRAPSGGDAKIQISAALADARPEPSLVPYGPPPGLIWPNTRRVVYNPVQDPKVDPSTHREPLVVTRMRPTRNHEASTSAQAVHFKNQRSFAIFEDSERINKPSSTDKQLPSTMTDLAIGAVFLSSPEPTPERVKGKAKCPLDSEIPIEILSPVPPSPHEYLKPIGLASRPRNSKDYRSPILAGKDHKLVGSGTTAVVFRGPSATRGRFRATKVISLTAVPYDIVIDAYVEEVRVLQQLTAKKAEAREKGEVDPGMERVMALDDPDDRMELLSDGRLCITTDYYPADLSSYAGMISGNEEALLTILAEIAQGLKYLHSLDIVHLDIKPENIFLTLNRHCVIGDYGGSNYAPEVNKSGLVSTAALYTTPGYSAPEVSVQRMMISYFDCRADIWSLGVLMFHMIVPWGITFPDPLARAEKFVDYKTMGLLQEDMKASMLKASDPPSVDVMNLVLRMCEMIAFKRITADDVLKEMKQPHPDSIDTSKPSPLLSYQPPTKAPTYPPIQRARLSGDDAIDKFLKSLEARGGSPLTILNRPS